MSEPRWLDEREARAWRGFALMRMHLDRQLEQQMLRDADLSAADYALLVPLSEADPHVMRARDLGRLTGWDRSRLSHQVRRMEQRGLLERRRCDTDARGTDIALTDKGWSAVSAAAPGHVATVRSLFVDLLEPAELDTLAAISERVLSRLRSGCAEADAAADATCEAADAESASDGCEAGGGDC
ncbi:MAG: MarR family winged helix-turn-helix transcriptional regulator [bacterium]